MKHKRVLIALGWYDYRLHRGIERYAQEHAWSLSANLAREPIVPWGWEGDGILAWLGAWDELAEFVERQNKPTVDFSFRRPHLRFPRVLEDHAQAAQLVADHFLCRGFSNFAFYADAENWSYEERGNHFARALRRARYACNWLKWYQCSDAGSGREAWKRKRDWLAGWLRKWGRPLAVFAANDQLALDVLEACEHSRLLVPDEVAIVGAENYLLAPDAMRIPISSVDTNLETLGYRGAELLDRLMQGKAAPARPIRVPPAGLVARRSSDLLTIPHPGVARALRFAWDHSHEPITVKDLVSVAGMSRRGLQYAFLEQLGRTPGQELHRARIERAKRLILDARHKVDEVARMCGFQSANSFGVAFKHATGMSPKQFRIRNGLKKKLAFFTGATGVLNFHDSLPKPADDDIAKPNILFNGSPKDARR